MSKVRVTLAYGREVDGKSRKAGDVVAVDEAIARRFVIEGAAALAPREPVKKRTRKTKSVAAPAADTASDMKEK